MKILCVTVTRLENQFRIVIPLETFLTDLFRFIESLKDILVTRAKDI